MRYFRTTSAVFPHYFCGISTLFHAVCLHYFRTISVIFPHYFCDISALFLPYFRTITAVFCTISVAFPHYYCIISALYFCGIAALYLWHFRTISCNFEKVFFFLDLKWHSSILEIQKSILRLRKLRKHNTYQGEGLWRIQSICI